MQNGVVKMIDYYKGFGFIISEDENEVYFNLKDLHPKYKGKILKEGDMVGFDLKREIKGDRAVNVRPI